ncbi:hypothetical protein HmCmsJML201_03036 [Escherichia coli]|uniref:superinfection immunity protein n=1 Tax=Escherichia coli TaxID=562 RepID=UPI0010CADF97|nr:superinfection immunity protein [Escherichia coli]GDD10749.1 hypothetical protein HmCmsJML201_03036 [Escherichia coli]
MSSLPVSLILFALLAYFTPFLVAYFRNHKAKLAIFMANLFLGWVLLPWVFILIWACNSNVNEK